MFLNDILGLYTTRPIVNTSERSNSIQPSSAPYTVMSAIALWCNPYVTRGVYRLVLRTNRTFLPVSLCHCCVTSVLSALSIASIGF